MSSAGRNPRSRTCVIPLSLRCIGSYHLGTDQPSRTQSFLASFTPGLLTTTSRRLNPSVVECSLVLIILDPRTPFRFNRDCHSATKSFIKLKHRPGDSGAAPWGRMSMRHPFWPPAAVSRAALKQLGAWRVFASLQTSKFHQNQAS